MPEAIRYFFPGPTYVRESIRQAMQAPSAPHRSPSFLPVYARATHGLKDVFRTRNEVMIVSGSSTLGMEIGVLSTVRRNVLNLICGAFSERWHGICQSLGLEADALAVPWGRTHSPEDLRRALREKPYEAVTVVHCETSTGILNPLAELARVVREESDALILVDAVSSLGGAPVETDAWGLDYVVTGSQKALALPPGLALITASSRALARAEQKPHRGFYTDLLRYRDQHQKGGTITTPAEAQIHALAQQLDVIAQEGLEHRWQRHLNLQNLLRDWVEQNDVSYASVAEGLSPTVSCLKPYPGLEPKVLIQQLADQGWTIASGYGAWKSSTFRIGHMGEVQLDDLAALLEAIDHLLPPSSANV